MAVDVVVEEVADNLEELAEATRRINTTSVGFFVGGFAVGAVFGFFWGYRYNKEAIKAEAYKQSEKEVAKIRDLYQAKAVAAQPKPTVEEMIEEKGYSVIAPTPERPLPPPVPVQEPVEVVIIEDKSKSKDEGWHYPLEQQGRSPGHPYVIHQDEFKANEHGYDQVTYTFYEVDEVMVEESGTRQPLDHVDFTVGLSNLKWGHGSDDPDVVYVRNDRLEMEMEICRLHKSYEEEVMGLDGNEPD